VDALAVEKLARRLQNSLPRRLRQRSFQTGHGFRCG
jgi:hypothetical protein